MRVKRDRVCDAAPVEPTVVMIKAERIMATKWNQFSFDETKGERASTGKMSHALDKGTR